MRLARQLLIFVVLLSGVCHAVPLPDDLREYPLDGHIEYLEDPDGALTISDVIERKHWRKNEQRVFNQGYNNSVWWLKISLDNPRDRHRDYLLEIAYAVLDHAAIFMVQNQMVTRTILLGDKQRFSDRLIKHRFYLVPIHWGAQARIDIYARIKTGSSVQVPITLWDRDAYLEHDTIITLLNGIFFGTMIIMFLYNLLIYSVLRSRVYLFYVGYVFSMIIMLAGIGGYSFQYLWPGAVQWNDRSILVALSGIAVFGTLFSKSFLQIKVYSKFSSHLTNVFIGCAAAIFILSFISPYGYVIRAMVILAVIACVSMFFIAIYCFAKGAVSARYYIMAWSFMLAGCTVLAFNKLSLLPNNLLTEYAAHFGSSIETMMLSFALAQNINHERKLRLAAQQKALRLQQAHNKELEQKVAERTQALQDLNARLLTLSTTDQLTGLKNRRYLDDILQKEFLRARRYNKPLGILMMDIDHFKHFNDTYGHLAGDECLKLVADTAKNCARWPSDQVARYGGEEFCMILAETDEAGARAVGERIRARVQALKLNWQNQILSVTISVGIYIAMPSDEETCQTAFDLADQALYQSKQGGRNRVTVYQQHSIS